MWSDVAELLPQAPQLLGQFGTSVVTSGGWVVSGSELYDGGDPGQEDIGAAYVVELDLSYLAGNVDTGDGSPPADVLYLNGSAGDACREVVVQALTDYRLDVLHAPSVAPGRCHYAVWIFDGIPGPGATTPIRFMDRFGTVFDLGLGPRCLPISNSVAPGSCPCPTTFDRGFISMSFGSGTARNFCVNKRPGHDLAPNHFTVKFPQGDYVIGGIILDRNAPASPAKNAAIANWVVVRAR